MFMSGFTGFNHLVNVNEEVSEMRDEWLRPYQEESTASRPISEVKALRAWIVEQAIKTVTQKITRYTNLFKKRATKHRSMISPQQGLIDLKFEKRVKTSYITTKLTAIRRFANESWLRELCGGDRIKRAAWLVICKVCSLRNAAAALSNMKNKLSQMAVSRAITAIRDGRPIGQIGRPRHITKAMETDLLQWIEDRSKSSMAPTLEEIKSKVSILCFYSFSH